MIEQLEKVSIPFVAFFVSAAHVNVPGPPEVGVPDLIDSVIDAEELAVLPYAS